jgi:hypothetical protein
MDHPYSSFCDDFYINLRVGSQLALPNGRETILHFFEQLQRAYPTMCRFRKGDGAEYSIEEDRAANMYRWVSLESTRLSAGHVNPPDVATALKLHHLLLDIAPHQLGISPLELDYIDVLFGFDLEFAGNHDEIIAESLYENSPLSALLEIEGARPVDFQPTTVVALSDDVRLQARVDVVTRTSGHQVRSGNFGEDVISVYLIVRRFWDDLPKRSLTEVFAELAQRAEQLAESHVLPRIVRPIGSAIASRS